MGEALVEACPDGGNIFAINGSPTDKNVEEVELGFRKALKGSKLKIVYTGYCDNWLAEMAATHVNKGLEVTDDIVGVMCGNDDLASQAVKVLAENRLAGQVALVAQDADLAACQRIVEGTQTMTVYKPIEQEQAQRRSSQWHSETVQTLPQKTVRSRSQRPQMTVPARSHITRSHRSQ